LRPARPGGRPDRGRDHRHGRLVPLPALPGGGGQAGRPREQAVTGWTLGRLGGVVAAALALATAGHAADFAEWRYRQEGHVPSSGLVPLRPPADPPDAAPRALAALRLADPSGQEGPSLVERPVPAGDRARDARAFQVTLDPSAPVAVVETGLAEPLEAVTLATPARGFVKAVQVEG